MNGAPLGLTLLDYWRWSGSDLLGNAERGVLAEFLVASALGAAHEPRAEWAVHDVRASLGGADVTVEVKSAAWYQSWHQERPSDIRFDIAPRKWLWNPETNGSVELRKPRRFASVYVFCVLGAPDGSRPDPFETDQWGFYVLDTASLDRAKPRQQTIGLRPLRAAGAGRDRARRREVRGPARGRPRPLPLTPPTAFDARSRTLYRYREHFPQRPEMHAGLGCGPTLP